MDFFKQFRGREVAILRDDLSPTARSALVSPASLCSARRINHLTRITGGLVCVALSPLRTNQLMLTPMSRPTSIASFSKDLVTSLRFCTSVDAREGISTGISASDRATTIRLLGEEVANPRALVSPGHIIPIETKQGGVLVRHTLGEGAVDLCRGAGFSDAALIMDALDSHGEYLSPAGQESLAQQENWPLYRLSELIEHRLRNEPLVHQVAEAKLPNQQAGALKARIYKSHLHSGEHLALIKGEITAHTIVATRVQSEQTFPDVFGGTCHSRQQIGDGLRTIKEEECGVLLYLRKSEAGGLRDYVKSQGHIAQTPSVATLREFGIGAQILYDIGVRRVKLITHGNENFRGLASFGIEIVGCQQLGDSGATVA